jgi:hypothetical protein
VRGDGLVVWEADGTLPVSFSTKPAGGAWSPAAALSAPGSTEISSPRSALGAHGDAVVGWVRDHALEVSTRARRGSFGAPLVLGPTTAQDDAGFRVAVNAAGHRLVVWNDAAGIEVQQGSRRGWRRSHLLAAGGSVQQAALTASGVASVIWSNGATVYESSRQPPARGWTTVLLAAPPAAAFAANAAGAEALVWHAPGSFALQALVKPAGASWPVAPEAVPGAAGVFERVGIDAAGAVTVAWEASNGDVWSADRSPAGSWAAASDVVPQQPPVGGHVWTQLLPSLAVAPSGAMALSVEEQRDIQFNWRGASRPAGGAWTCCSSPDVPYSATGSGVDPQAIVAVGDEGAATVAAVFARTIHLSDYAP